MSETENVDYILSSDLQVILKEQGVSEDSKQQLVKAFGGPFKEAGEILKDFSSDEETGALVVGEDAVKVTDVTQIKEMNLAKKQRLAIKKVRTTIEKKRKELKEDSLKTGRAIDAVANFTKSIIEPVEDYLETQEKYADIIREKEEAERLTMRTEEVAKYGDPSMYSLSGMSDEQFDKLLADLKQAEGDRIANEKEAARLKKVAEDAEIAKQKALEEENERLRKEAESQKAADIRKTNRVNQVSQMGMAWNGETSSYESHDQFIASQDILDLDATHWQELIDAVQSKLTGYREAEAEARHKEQEARDAEILKQQAAADAERKRLKDLQDKEDARIAEEKRIADEKEEAQRKALLAPDKEKLTAYADEIAALNAPHVSSREAGVLVDETADFLDRICKNLRKKAEEL